MLILLLELLAFNQTDHPRITHGLIYRNYEDDEALQKLFESMKRRYANFPSALAKILDLESKKTLLCQTLTREHYSCGACSNQRSESLNSDM